MCSVVLYTYTYHLNDHFHSVSELVRDLFHFVQTCMSCLDESKHFMSVFVPSYGVLFRCLLCLVLSAFVIIQ